MKWTKEVVEHLENTCFHNKITGEVLNRESDKYYQEKIKENYLPDTDQRVLDFGCGTARQLELFKIDHQDYTGYDTSEAMLEKAKEKFPGYIFTSHLQDDPFDLVISNDVLQHVRDLEEFKNLLIQMCNIGNNVIAHFWYDEKFTRLKEVEIHGQVFSEFFISKADLEKVLEGISDDIYIRYFDKEEPYPCCVVGINMIKPEDILKTITHDIGFNHELLKNEPSYISKLEDISLPDIILDEFEGY